jgi:hypothetical protein
MIGELFFGLRQHSVVFNGLASDLGSKGGATMANSVLTDSFKLGQYYANSVTNLPIAWHTYATLQAMLQTATSTAFSDANKESVVYENTATYGPGISGNEVAATGNYVARGNTCTGVDASIASHVVKMVAAIPAWTTATITATGLYFVGQTGAAAAGSTPAVGYWDFSGSVSSTSGTFTVTQPGAGWFTNS